MNTQQNAFFGLWTHSCGSNNALWYGSTLEEAAQAWRDLVAKGEADVDLTAYGAGTVATHAEMQWRYGTTTGTFACPICGQDTPHQHSVASIAFHRDNEAHLQQRMEARWHEIEARIARLAADPGASTSFPAPPAAEATAGEQTCHCPCCIAGVEAPHEYHLERRKMK